VAAETAFLGWQRGCMTFDKLWWAIRRDDKHRKKLKAHYYPLLEAARNEKDEKKHSKILWEYQNELDFVDDGKALRTNIVVNRAKRLGIQLPKKPDFGTEEADENEDWIENRATGNLYLTDKAIHPLRIQIREEENGRLEHKMRYVRTIVVPLGGLLIGLIGSIMGLISLIHSLKWGSH
jgi:hypothetical protein